MDYKNLVTSAGGYVSYSPASPYNSPALYATAQRVGWEWVNPGAKVSGNRRDPNPWSYSVRRQSWPLGTSRRTYWETWSEGNPAVSKEGYGRQEQCISSPLSCYDAEDSVSEILGRADEEAYQKLIESARGSIDLSVDLFQARQTAAMLNATERFTNAFVKRAPGKISAKGIARQLGGKWLEWVYGWGPLLSTIHDLVEESLRYHINSTVKVKGRRSLQQISTPLVTSTTPNGPVGHRVNVRAFAKVQYVVELRVMDNDLSRLTSLNPASIAWELVPYSFVVDWFLDIGGYLRGLETAFLYQDRFVRGYKTSVYGSSCTTSVSRSSVLPNSNGEMISDVFSADSYSVDFNRSVLAGFPFPNAPKLRLDLSSKRLLNAAALLSQHLQH